jgi:hypothetical protein
VKNVIFWDVTLCGRVLARHNIESVGLPQMKLSNLLHPVKDDLGLRTSVYKIPCECGRVYTEQMGRSMDIGLKEHQWHIRLEHPDKPAIVEHSIKNRHHTQFHNSSILGTKTINMDPILTVAIGIELYSYYINREGGF